MQVSGFMAGTMRRVALLGGWLLAIGACTTQFVGPPCGNGLADADEECDDGNREDGDGCASTCAIEPGWSCTGEPAVCTLSSNCGDGLVEPDEACDDGNLDSGDGCSGDCEVEPGFSCTGEPSICISSGTCGDGVVDPGEACDDGDTDECTGQCNATCTGPSNSCGDGNILCGEGCDGANLGGQTCGDHGFSGGSLACDGGCQLDLSGCTSAGSCASQYDSAPGFIDCLQTGSECEFQANVSTESCSVVCGARGGECLDVFNNSGACGHAEQLACDDTGYTSVICICSRGCGGGPACGGGQTCQTGLCQ